MERTLQAGQVGVLGFGLQQVRQAGVPVAEATALTERKKTAVRGGRGGADSCEREGGVDHHSLNFTFYDPL